MAHALTQGIRTSHAHERRMPAVDDSLNPIRGIVIGTLLSIIGFWLPLALVLTR